MTDLIFSFDTEDFTSEHGADAILAEAEILRSEGIKGCFAMVGLLAKQLEAWGRTDVLEALSHHEIDFHSYGHTYHPTINEYTDIDDFEAAKAEFIKQESSGMEYVRHATGAKEFFAAVPPGHSHSYVAKYGYADMGLPIYADTPCCVEDGRGLYYCNMFNMKYSCKLEGLLFKGTEEDLWAELEVQAKRRFAIIYTHPQRALYKSYWDGINYNKTNQYPFGQWKECSRNTPEETETFYANFRKFVRMIKADERFRIITYGQLAKELEAEKNRKILRSDIPGLRNQLKEAFYPVTLPDSYCLADIFLACREFLSGKTEYTCGTVYGFLREPFAISSPVTVSAQELRRSAQNMVTDRFLPEKIQVGDVLLGPGDWLRGALEVLCGAETATLQPGPKLPCMNGHEPMYEMPLLRDLNYVGGWLEGDDFKDTYLSNRLRLQIWTMRFRRGSSRFVTWIPHKMTV